MSVKLLTFEQIYLNVIKIEQYLYFPLKNNTKRMFLWYVGNYTDSVISTSYLSGKSQNFL